MVSSGEVNGDSQALQGLFSSYTSQMDSVNNNSVWQGLSKDNAVNLSSQFVSEYKETLSSQLSSFANALNKYESYKSAKASRESAIASANSTTDKDSKTYYINQANSYSDQMDELKSEINELLSNVISQKLESAVSTVEAYQNYITLNDFVNYFQTDYHQSYGGGATIASAGCGPTSMAMVLTYLTGETITPVDTASYSMAHGHRVIGNGTNASLFPAMAAEYGLECREENPSAENIIRSLSEGNVIIAHMGPGTFTSQGHYIVLKGLDENGRVIVADPNSRERTDKSFDASLIARESAASMYSFPV